jgi:hypothetical protein
MSTRVIGSDQSYANLTSVPAAVASASSSQQVDPFSGRYFARILPDCQNMTRELPFASTAFGIIRILKNAIPAGGSEDTCPKCYITYNDKVYFPDHHMTPSCPGSLACLGEYYDVFVPDLPEGREIKVMIGRSWVYLPTAITATQKSGIYTICRPGRDVQGKVAYEPLVLPVLKGNPLDASYRNLNSPFVVMVEDETVKLENAVAADRYYRFENHTSDLHILFLKVVDKLEPRDQKRLAISVTLPPKWSVSLAQGLIRNQWMRIAQLTYTDFKEESCPDLFLESIVDTAAKT